jgi:hypothetical protein
MGIGITHVNVKERRKVLWLPEPRHVVASGDAGHFFGTNEPPEELGIKFFFFDPPLNFARRARSII